MKVSVLGFSGYSKQGPFFSSNISYPGSNNICWNVIYVFYGISAMNSFIFRIHMFWIIAQSIHKCMGNVYLFMLCIRARALIHVTALPVT